MHFEFTSNLDTFLSNQKSDFDHRLKRWPGKNSIERLAIYLAIRFVN